MREELPADERVEFWRRRRDLTSSHRCDDYTEGEPHDSVQEIAAALRIDVPLLMGRDPQPQPLDVSDPIGENLDRVREFLERSDAMGPGPGTAVPSLAAITMMLRDAWQAYRHAEYDTLMAALPRLLRGAAVSDRSRVGGPEGAEASRLLSQAYQVTAAALRKLGEYHLSWLTADRAIEAAGRGRDRLLAATAARFVSAALLAIGRPAAAFNLTMAVTRAFPEGGGPDPVIGGSLLLQSAAAAARMGDTAATRGLLSSAGAVATRLGCDADRYWTRFGPTAVELSRASAAVDLGDGGQAISVHHRLPPSRLDDLPREQHAGHYLTLARAYLQVGGIGRAARALDTSTRIAPGEAHSPLHQAIRLQIRTA
ncbi:helix-turn-helix transcriptional regulator [Actinoplanes sichuanensis]|uniref:Transcriptional regulator n=1 Tax=Actinoplanes sichuanensis TaxID=512349 RepID=A0ABW4AAU1_9ACTN|nr:transcriptional regulator [Actinoplanes sichuanensis]BEL05349.1 helix-turn-helix transcriptional regulator [Actinoplanes sichuanensis]